MKSTHKNIENHLDATEAKWFAVYTQYKREKLVLRTLEQKGIHCYVPLQKLRRYYTRKIKEVELPLLSCYVFVKITKSEYVRVLETEYVYKFIRFSGNLISIPQSEIDVLKMITGEDQPIEVANDIYEEGDLVEVIGGRLTGMRGELVKKENTNFKIILDALGVSLSIAINSKYLKKVGRAVRA